MRVPPVQEAGEMKQYFCLRAGEAWVLVGLFFLAFLFRLFLYNLEPIVLPDGIIYTEAGINLIAGKGYVNSSGEYYGGFRPLYPIFIGLTNLFIQDHTFSGALVSMFFGSLLIFPLFLYARNLYEARIAWISVVLVITYPFLSNYASTALTESTYTFFLFTSVYTAWIAYREKDTRAFVLCGLTTALAYLTRFEAFFFIPIYILFFLLSSPVRNYKGIFAMMAVFISCAAPFLVYHIYILTLQGIKTPLDSVFTDASSFLKIFIKNLGDMYTELLPTVFPPLLMMVSTIAIFESIRKKTFGFNEIFLGSVIVLHLVGYSILFASGRNLTSALPFLLMFVSKGIGDLGGIIVENVAWSNSKVMNDVFALSVIVGSVALSVLPQSLRPLILGPDPQAPWEMMEMGKWIKENLPPQNYIMSLGREVSFYANSKPIPFNFKYSEILAKARKYRVQYVVIGSYRASSEVGLQYLLDEISSHSDLTLVREVQKRSGWARLYRLEEG